MARVLFSAFRHKAKGLLSNFGDRSVAEPWNEFVIRKVISPNANRRRLRFVIAIANVETGENLHHREPIEFAEKQKADR